MRRNAIWLWPLMLLLAACVGCSASGWSGPTPTITVLVMTPAALEERTAAASPPDATPSPTSVTGVVAPIDTATATATPGLAQPTATATYRDEAAGFAFDHPATWARAAQTIGGTQGRIVQLREEGEPRLDVAVLRWDPPGDLEAFVAARKAAWAATGATIVSEEAITTTGGLAATRLVVRSAAGEAALYGFAALGERYIQLSGAGDLDRLSEIVATLRPALVADALDCAEPEEGTLTWVVCNVRDGILSRNLTAIHSFMADPFLIGYWRSQGHAATPREITAELLAQRLPADTSLPMAFTTDREAFPPLGGQPAEALLGPEVKIDLIVYSEGWGPEGQGAALLYFAQVGDRYLWHSLVYAPTHFDK